MVVIGVTGTIGTGKSTVARMFHHLGAAVLDADVIAHQALEPKRLAWRKTVEVFGQGILNDDLTINRRWLAQIVFRDPQKRERLERIIHPQVLRAIRRHLHQLARQRRTRAVVLDVPLLVEVGAQGLVDALVVVTAPPVVQHERLHKRYGWTGEQIVQRLAAQLELSAKVALADYVVDNGDGVDATRTQVKRIWNQVVRSSSKRSSTSRR